MAGARCRNAAHLRKVLASEMGARGVVLAPFAGFFGVGGVEQDGLELLVGQDLAIAVGGRVAAVVGAVVVVRPNEEGLEEEGEEAPEGDAGGGDEKEASAGAVLAPATLLGEGGGAGCADERRGLAVLSVGGHFLWRRRGPKRRCEPCAS